MGNDSSEKKVYHHWNSNPEEHEDFGKDEEQTPRIGHVYEDNDDEEDNETVEV